MAVLALGIGGGGVYFFIQQVQKQKKKGASAKAKAKEEGSPTVTIVRKERKVKKKVDPLKELEGTVDELLSGSKFKEALAALGEYESEHSGSKSRRIVAALRENVNGKAQERLKRDREKTEALVASKDFDGALSLLADIQEYGLESAPEEARARAVEVEVIKKSQGLLTRIAACDRIGAALAPALKELDYKSVESVLAEQAAVKENQVFADELASKREDVQAIRQLWAQFLETMKAKTGREEMFGIRKGKVVGVRDGDLVMDVNGIEETFSLRGFQPKWIEDRMGLSAEDADPEMKYALGLLYLHRGRTPQAKVIFKELEDHAGVQRQLEWMEWQLEVEAKASIDELRRSGKDRDPRETSKILAKLREGYQDTRIAKLESAFITQLGELTDLELAERTKRINERIEMVKTFTLQEKAGIDNWFEVKKAEVQDLLVKELVDDFTYHKVVHKPEPGKKKPYNVAWVGRCKEGLLGYFERKDKTTKGANLAVVKEILEDVRADGARRTMIKHLKNETQRLEREIRLANSRARDRATKLKSLYSGKLDDLRDRELRTIRKVKSGEEYTEEEIEKMLSPSLRREPEKPPEEGAGKEPLEEPE